MPKVLLVAVLLASVNAGADDRYGTREEAQSLVHKAVGHIKAVGADTAYADFTRQAPEFIDRDLYIVVYDLDGRVLAHGQHAKLVGENLLNLRDPGGKLWIKERVELARKKERFWHDYKFLDPVTKKTLEKSTYCERVESTAVCAGVYKR